MTYHTEHRPADIDVTTGSADDPGAFPPTQHVLAEEKVSWVKTD